MEVFGWTVAGLMAVLLVFALVGSELNARYEDQQNRVRKEDP